MGKVLELKCEILEWGSSDPKPSAVRIGRDTQLAEYILHNRVNASQSLLLYT